MTAGKDSKRTRHVVRWSYYFEMSRRFHSSVECGLGIRQIHAAFCERDFWLARLSESGSAATMDTFDVDANGSLRLVVVQDAGGSVIPGPLKRLYPGGLTIVQDQRWTLESDEKLCGAVRTEGRGAAGAGVSRLLLERSRDGGRIACTGTLEVNVPFVGGAIETLLGRQMSEQTPELLRFTASWIDART